MGQDRQGQSEKPMFLRFARPEYQTDWKQVEREATKEHCWREIAVYSPASFAVFQKVADLCDALTNVVATWGVLTKFELVSPQGDKVLSGVYNKHEYMWVSVGEELASDIEVPPKSAWLTDVRASHRLDTLVRNNRVVTTDDNAPLGLAGERFVYVLHPSARKYTKKGMRQMLE